MASLHWSGWVVRFSRSAGTSGFEHAREWAIAHSPHAVRSRAAVIAGGATLGLLAFLSLRAAPSSPAPRVPSFGLAAGFEANLGQTASPTRFIAHGDDFVLLLDPHDVRLRSAGCG